MSPGSPVGLELGKNPRNPQWKIGKRLGSGACASVHVLETTSGNPTEYAIKLAALPTKTTTKKNSTAEVNERLLYHENLVYQNAFAVLQGKIIPKLPSAKGPPATGTIEGKLAVLSL